MKLNRELLVDNKPYPVIDEWVVLSLSTPGRAQFTVDANDQPIKPRQLVAFQIGYTQQKTMSRLFFGYVESVTDIDRRQRLFCRELSAVLNNPLPLNLRHVKLTSVLAEITRLTGLKFSVPDMPYASTHVANFYNLGNGYQALDRIQSVFSIDDYFWQQQGHGVIYVGSWTDSRWSSRAADISPRLFDQQTNETARVAAIPMLRPGVALNGHRVVDLQFKDNHMEVSWKVQ